AHDETQARRSHWAAELGQLADDVRRHLLRGAIAVVGILGEGEEQDAMDPFREVGDDLREIRELAADDGAQRLLDRSAREKNLAGEEFVEYHSDAVEIGAVVDALAAEHLGGDVAGLAFEDAFPKTAVAGGDVADPEVGDFNLPEEGGH